MAIPAKEFTAPNGDRFTINPLTPGRLLAALAELKEQGLEFDPSKKGTHASIAFGVAVARQCLSAWKRNDGGTMNEMGARERETLILENFDAVSFISEKANEVAGEAKKAWAGDQKNS